MNENELLIKNRLREATVILERANLIICDESWKCDSSRPPFSSFQLVIQGEGTVQVDQTVLHPHAGQLYLLRSEERRVGNGPLSAGSVSSLC